MKFDSWSGIKQARKDWATEFQHEICRSDRLEAEMNEGCFSN